MPDLVTSLFLFAGGAIAGSLVNWAIYSLGYFQQRLISPWSTPDRKAPLRKALDRVPIYGWIGMRREESIHGRGFWIRPLLIELALACFAVWFWQWQHDAGLLGKRIQDLPEWNAQLWFSAHILLIVLLTIATFIDFDEKTIPDWITIPGTVAGLLFAVTAPEFHLPELVGTTAGLEWENIDFASPHDEVIYQWPWDWRGLAAGLATIIIWGIALLPKICTLRFGIGNGVKLMLASIIRPRRKTDCKIRIDQRGPFGITWVLGLLALLLCVMTVAVWFVAGRTFPQWNSLLSSLMGMAMGGGAVWAVRIVASNALGQEAMGFGDVTLMAMVGTFLGWQASLMVFALAPFAALLIAAIQFTVTKNRELAFGPYLALAALVVIIGWSPLWKDNARNGFFQMQSLLLGVLAASLVLMALMLFGLRWMRGNE